MKFGIHNPPGCSVRINTKSSRKSSARRNGGDARLHLVFIDGPFDPNPRVGVADEPFMEGWSTLRRWPRSRRRRGSRCWSPRLDIATRRIWQRSRPESTSSAADDSRWASRRLECSGIYPIWWMFPEKPPSASSRWKKRFNSS